MKVSIIIPTYNGSHKILKTLKCLEKQSFKNFEVIVVIDGSTDCTADLLKKQKFDFQSFKIIEQANQGRAKVRNNGAEISQCDLLIFFDDDMRPLQDCVLKHVEHQKKYFDSILTGGVGMDLNQCKTDFQLYRAHLDKKWGLALENKFEVQMTKENLFLSAANFSISKKMFFELGAFDEDLNDAEDYDFAVRAYKNNSKLYFNRSAFAWHDDFINCQSYIKRLREYHKFQILLQRKKPELYAEFYLRKVIKPKKIKSLFFIFFTNIFWIKSIDGFNWLKIFPKIFKYKIYDLITTANGVYYPEKVQL